MARFLRGLEKFKNRVLVRIDEALEPWTGNGRYLQSGREEDW